MNNGECKFNMQNIVLIFHIPQTAWKRNCKLGLAYNVYKKQTQTNITNKIIYFTVIGYKKIRPYRFMEQ